MKNKKIKIFGFVLICFSLIILIGFNNNKEIEKVDFHGKVMGYNNLEELEDASPVIIRGIKKKEDSVEVFRSEVNDEVIGGYTESSFVISDVYKNSEDKKDIKQGNEIKISEMAFYDKETNTIYSVNNYENMNFNKEYLLFLVPVDNDMYSSRGVTFGTVPMFETVSKNVDVDTDIITNVIQEAQVKYKNK